MSTLSPGVRVAHANSLVSYGNGEISFIHPPVLPRRPPTFAQVQFDGDRTSRRVYLADLAPAPRASDPVPGPRIVWPVERAGEHVPVVA